MRLPKRALYLALIACALLCAGCSNNPYPRQDWDRPIIYRALSQDPKTLDPSVAYVVDEAEILGDICDTFLQYDYFKRNPYVLIPSLGASMPTRRPYRFVEQAPVLDKKGRPEKDAAGHPLTKPVTRDGERWTFTIKRGVRFQNDPCFPGGRGREVTAADFVYAFKRMEDPTVPCPILQYTLPHVVGLQELFDHNVAVEAWQKAHGRPIHADYRFPVPGLFVDPHDPYTFHVILRDHYPQLKYLMAMAFTTPIPHEAVDYYDRNGQDGMRKHPVGEGPYRLAKHGWISKEHIILVRNENYRRDTYPTDGSPEDRAKGLLVDAGKPLPLTPEVFYTIVRETIPGWNLFLQGYMDAWGVPRESFNRVISRQGLLSPDMKRRGIVLEKSAGLDVSYLAFNMEDPVVGGYSLKKRRLRQAISTAFDTREYQDLLTSGQGIPAQSALPPGIFGYDPAYRNPYRQTSIPRAKQLLAEAGYPGGIDPKTGRPLEINFDNQGTTAGGRQAVLLVIKQLGRIGIRVISRAWLGPAFEDKINSGNFQMTQWGWDADYPDPENFYLLFYGPNKGPGPNAARYHNPQFDALFPRMAAMDDGPQRLALIRRLRAIVQEDCPWVFIDHSEALWLHYDWYKNLKSLPVSYNTSKYLRIDAQERYSRRLAWNRPRYGVVAWALAALLAGSLLALTLTSVARSQPGRVRRRAPREGPS